MVECGISLHLSIPCPSASAIFFWSLTFRPFRDIMKYWKNQKIVIVRIARGADMKEKRNKRNAACCGSTTASGNATCCRVEALVTVDSRGQIVLPKDVRERAGIEAGDKLAVVGFESDDRVCCISLVKADAFADTVKEMLGPMMAEIFQSQ